MATLRKFTFISDEGFAEEQETDSMLSLGKVSLLGVDGVAIDAGLAKLVQLANGTDAGDAVNFGQLSGLETALDARLDSIESNLATEQVTVYENNTGVIADGQPPVADAAYREGWYYTNVTTGQKINWYYFDGQAENISLGEFSGQAGATGGLSSIWAVVTLDSTVSSPILTVYTVPGASGNAASWYRSKMVYSNTQSAVVGKKYLIYAGANPDVHTELPRIQLQKMGNSAGPQAASERILTISFGTDSGSSAGNVKLCAESLGLSSSAFDREVLLRFRKATLVSVTSLTNALDQRLDTLEADPVTKSYVDAAIQGLDVKLSCRAATTGNITLSGLQTIDNVALAGGDRVLVKAQDNAAENGIYTASAGSWTRAFDANSDAEVTSGLFTFIEEGDTHANNGYVLVTDGAITLGTTELTFTQFTGAGQVVPGNGLTKSGNVLSVIHAPYLMSMHPAGENVAAGDPVVFSSTPNTLSKALASSNALARVVGVAAAGASTGEATNVIKRGVAAGVLSGATPGEPVYLASAGGLTQTAPTTGRVIRVGFAITETDLEVEIADYGMRL